jgi:hypothetical protein
MAEIPEAARKRFAKLADDLGGVPGRASPHLEGFGTGSMFVGRKMFAVLDPSGSLVIKLPPTRVAELIDGGVGAPWHPGGGTPLKEYISIPASRARRWLPLARESREYMARKP